MSESSKSLPSLCAFYDQGGGVEFDGAFIVNTNISLPERWQDRKLWSPSLIQDLSSAAGEVEKAIKFFLAPQNMPEGWRLRVLPCPEVHPTNLMQRRPWFAINAAKASKHSIFGCDDTITTLILLLRRPWCVLELCCSTIDAVHSLLAFARIVAAEDPSGYNAAVQLLSYEEWSRTGSIEDHDKTRASMERLQALSLALYPVSERSYDGFWLRLICFCAVRQNMSLVLLIRSLDSTDDGCTVTEEHFFQMKLSRAATFSDASSYIRPDSPNSVDRPGGRVSLIRMYKHIVAELTRWVA